MTKTRPQFVFATLITSGLALVLSVVALGTSEWIIAGVDLNTATGGSLNNRVNYGLFSGSYSRQVSTEAQYLLHITCDFGRNKCAMLCGDFDLRNNFLQALFQNDTRDGYRNCDRTGFSTLQSRFQRSLQVDFRADDDYVIQDGFIDSGVWLSTVLFLCLSCLFGVISCLLAIFNTVANPVETFLSVMGLFLYNCFAFVCSLIVLLLWGVHYALILSDNVALYDTIILAGNSAGKAALGYSYWLNLVGAIGYAASGILLIVRKYLIDREPDTIVNLEDKNDNTIILF